MRRGSQAQLSYPQQPAHLKAPSAWPDPSSTNCPPCSAVRWTACRMRWIPFWGTSRVTQTTRGLAGSGSSLSPCCRYLQVGAVLLGTSGMGQRQTLLWGEWIALEVGWRMGSTTTSWQGVGEAGRPQLPGANQQMRGGVTGRRPCQRHLLQRALPPNWSVLKLAGRVGSVAGFQLTVSMPFRMPWNFARTSGLQEGWM